MVDFGPQANVVTFPFWTMQNPPRAHALCAHRALHLLTDMCEPNVKTYARALKDM